MADITFNAVTRDGKPGKTLGTVTLKDGQVASTPGIAAETMAMLARRHRRSEVEIFERLRSDGWSNGWVMAVTVE